MLIVVAACQRAVTVPGERPAELPVLADVSAPAAKLRGSEEVIRGKASEIRTTALDVEQKAPEVKPEMLDIYTDAGDIIGEAGTLLDRAEELDAAQGQITARDERQTKDVTDAAGTIKALTVELEKERSERGRWERFFWLMWKAAGAGALVAAALSAVFLSKKLAGGLAVGGAATLAVGVFMHDWGGVLSWVLLGAAGLGLVVTGLLIWLKYRHEWKAALLKAKFYRDAVDDEKSEGVREVVAAERTANPLLNQAMEVVKEQSPKVDPVIVAAVAEVVKRNGNGGRGTAGVRTEPRPAHPLGPQTPSVTEEDAEALEATGVRL